MMRRLKHFIAMVFVYFAEEKIKKSKKIFNKFIYFKEEDMEFRCLFSKRRRISRADHQFIYYIFDTENKCSIFAGALKRTEKHKYC